MYGSGQHHNAALPGQNQGLRQVPSGRYRLPHLTYLADTAKPSVFMLVCVSPIWSVHWFHSRITQTSVGDFHKVFGKSNPFG